MHFQPAAFCLLTFALLGLGADAHEKRPAKQLARAATTKTVTRYITQPQKTVTVTQSKTVTRDAPACASNSNANAVVRPSSSSAATSGGSRGTSTAGGASTSTARATSTTASSSAAAAASSAAGSGQLLLSAHNAKRAIHQVPNLTWNQTLADYASKYASNCEFKHSGGPYGENLAAGAPFASYSDEALFNGWYNEGNDYNYSTTQFSSADGHFTQVVWKGTTQVGCAIVSCDSNKLGLGNYGQAKYLICEYSPPGNVQGQFTQNVLPPKN